MQLAHLPNAITIARMALAPPLAWYVLDGEYEIALIIALLAGGSDAVDGFLAKRFGWQSWLGGVLDPLADKLMLVAAFAALTVQAAIPVWLFALVIGRDLLIVGGAATYHFRVGRLDAQPTLLSKLTTVLQIVYVLAVLVDLLPTLALPRAAITTLAVTVAVATVSSGIHYVVRWSLRARRAAGKRHAA